MTLDATTPQNGGRRPRLEDVAAEVGVSPASVSLVLRGAPGPSASTREKVLEAATRLGYRPDRAASLLARRRSGMLGVVMDVRSTFHAELVEELLAAAETRGYDLVLGARTPARDEDRAVETLVDSRCEALVLLGTEAPASRLAELDRQVPVVAVGRRVDRAGVDVVRIPDDEGTGLSVAHLTGLGHTGIAYLDGGAGAIATDRRHGYRSAMQQAGLGDRIRVLPGDHTEEAGARAGHALLAEGPLPTAVVAFNDRNALGLLDTLSRAGVDVPGQVSIVGYDDSPMARLAHVDLTSVSQDVTGLVEHTLTAIVERLDGGRTDHREVLLPPRLVVRGTSGPPRTS
ncbi:MAG: LacI family DNA-binding transcriptional regulator [Pseudonocardia sediminis]